ncbi:MAG: endonuclease III [Candidatus Riflebacteria bacterium]|nr:endonuclease III [Candidatus Riflebacteria bacterium]
MKKNMKKFAEEIISSLKKVYPDASCELVFENPEQLLVATILSAQCTDERVNIVTKKLFQKYKTLKDFSQAEFKILAEEIRSTGFYQNKAKNIIACSTEIMEKHSGVIPKDMETLITLPGVGRKTANVILGSGYEIPSGIVVDTHVKRLSFRIGLTEQTDPEKIEFELMEIVSKEDWILFSHMLTWHGRRRCKARKPDCATCEIEKICPKNLQVQ